MPNTPRRRAILEAVRTRLQAIRQVDGYATDAGAHVFLNEAPVFGPDDAAVAIAILVGEDDPVFQGEHLLIRLPVEIQAIARADLDEPWLAVEDVLGDIKAAMELEDRTLGRLVKRQIERGRTTTLDREPGSEYVGAAIVYVAPYAERWGHPEV